MKVQGQTLDYRGWDNKRGSWRANCIPNRTGFWWRLIWGIKFYPSLRNGEFE